MDQKQVVGGVRAMRNYRITQRDREIVKFVEEYKSITINQCADMFMRDKPSGTQIARKRLAVLVKSGYLKVDKTDTSENVYYIDKKLRYHDLLINAFYIELHKIGATNIEFTKHKAWLNQKSINGSRYLESDGFFKFNFGGYDCYVVLEVCYTKKTIPLDKYEELYISGEAHNECEGIFPQIVVMDNSKHKEENFYGQSENIKITQIRFDLTDFPKILMV